MRITHKEFFNKLKDLMIEYDVEISPEFFNKQTYIEVNFDDEAYELFGDVSHYLEELLLIHHNKEEEWNL